MKTLNDIVKGIDIIYYINVDTHHERRKKMEMLFQDMSTKCIRINAVNGTTQQDFILNKIDKCGNLISILEYACMLSHLETIKLIAEDSTIETALIFEDDVSLDFQIYWKYSLDEIMANAPVDWEIIQLNYSMRPNRDVPEDLYTRNLTWSNGHSDYFCAQAYIIKKSACKKVIDTLYVTDKYVLPENKTHHADQLLFSILTTYVYKYPYFTFTYDNQSTLHPLHTLNHIKSRLKIDHMYKI